MLKLHLPIGFLLIYLVGSLGCKKSPDSRTSGGSGMVAQAVVYAAKKEPVSETLPLIGTITANEFVEIKPEMDGIISSIQFEEGQRLHKDQVLITLDDTKLAAVVAEAEANFKLSTLGFERSKQLLKDNLVSQHEFDQSAASFAMTQASLDLKRRQLKDAKVLAPFSGISGARHVSPGQVVTRSTTLTTLVDLDSVKVEIEIPERYLGQIKIGQQIAFSVAAYPTDSFPGKLYFIAPQVSENLRTATVKALISNDKHLLKPGMFASLTLTLLIKESAIVIPDVALMNNGDNALVFVVGKDDTASLRPVRIGERLAGKAEVLSGLAEGEEVVVEGHQKIAPGAKIKRSSSSKADTYKAKN